MSGFEVQAFDLLQARAELGEFGQLLRTATDPKERDQVLKAFDRWKNLCVLFGLFHANLWRLLPAGALGVVLSLIALEADSIVPAMITHFTNNACLVVLARLGIDDAASTVRVGLQVGLFLTSCAIFAVGALLVHQGGGRRRNLPKPLL